MSGRPIQVGDLVMIVRVSYCRACGYKDTSLGNVFTVKRVQYTDSDCGDCGLRSKDATVMAWQDDEWATETYRLKRIPPLGETEGRITEEENFLSHKEPA